MDIRPFFSPQTIETYDRAKAVRQCPDLSPHEKRALVAALEYQNDYQVEAWTIRHERLAVAARGRQRAESFRSIALSRYNPFRIWARLFVDPSTYLTNVDFQADEERREYVNKHAGPLVERQREASNHLEACARRNFNRLVKRGGPLARQIWNEINPNGGTRMLFTEKTPPARSLNKA